MTMRKNKIKSGFSLAEVMVASVIIGIVGVSAMRLFGGLAHSQAALKRTESAETLILDLISEIKQRDYMDGNGDYTSLGLETGESGSDRSSYDDVDDYHQLSENPPKFRNGTTYADMETFTRYTTVRWVSSADFNSESASDQGYKKVTIIINDSTREVARGVYIITNNQFDVNAYYGL